MIYTLKYFLEKKDGINELLINFFDYLEKKEIVIYNEISLQLELGIYLRFYFSDSSDFVIQFEKNANTLELKYKIPKGLKKEIDIYIKDKNTGELYSLELKAPNPYKKGHNNYINGFIEDIKFAQNLKNLGFKKTYALVIVRNKDYYEGKSSSNNSVYQYFRPNDGKCKSLYLNKSISSDLDDKLKNQTIICWKTIFNDKKIFDEVKDQSKYYIIEYNGDENE